MLEAERLLSVHQFEPRGIKTGDQWLVEALKRPTESVARLHLTVNPNLWYGKVYKGDLSGSNWEEFVRTFQEKAATDPQLHNPYTYISSDWTPVPIIRNTKVHQLLDDISGNLEEIAGQVRSNYTGEGGDDFAHYLEEVAIYLPEGKFDEAMQVWLRQDPTFPINWVAIPAEPYNDPLKIHYSFQSSLNYVDREMTKKLGQDMQNYQNAARVKYGYTPEPSAQVIAAKVVMLAGYLGEEGRSQVAFHLPNDPEVAKGAGTSLITLFEGRVVDKTLRILSPRLRQFVGLSCNVFDVMNLVVGHEFAHGYQYPGENTRWGDLWGVGRELWATDRTTVLSATEPFFSDRFNRSVIKGFLAYDLDDIGPFGGRLFEALGTNQPTLGELLAAGDYTAGGYIRLRQAFLHGAIKYKKLDYDKLNLGAEERDTILDEIGREGNREDAWKYLSGQLDTQKQYSGVDIKPPAA